ncbi:MAG: CDP-glucose 4,6-dehydratase [Rhodospirillaceae bacterium]
MTLPDPDFWRGRRVLITGHTGFKGAWLALWLTRMGATVTGYALAPEHANGIYAASGIARHITPVIADIRHESVLRTCLNLMRPDVVFHLAAQSLTRRAHQNPVETYDVNAVGTAKVLEALRTARSVRAAVIVTSDKVYENDDSGRAFTENDRLGAHEPYGASKVAAELAAAAFRESLGADHRLQVATVRAGNVIGGGDWAEDRLVPDAMRAFTANEPFTLRHPDSIRPWQYVLDPLCGYLLVAEGLLAGDRAAASSWNFGPDEGANLPVRDIAARLVDGWNEDAWDGSTAGWQTAGDEAGPYEAKILNVDSTKARSQLSWRPRMDIDQALAATVAWHKAQMRDEDMAEASVRALEAYLGH